MKNLKFKTISSTTFIQNLSEIRKIKLYNTLVVLWDMGVMSDGKLIMFEDHSVRKGMKKARSNRKLNEFNTVGARVRKECKENLKPNRTRTVTARRSDKLRRPTRRPLDDGGKLKET